MAGISGGENTNAKGGGLSTEEKNLPWAPQGSFSQNRGEGENCRNYGEQNLNSQPGRSMSKPTRGRGGGGKLERRIRVLRTQLMRSV